MERFYCTQCGHWHGTRDHGWQYCTAITHNETGGAQKCGCRHDRQEAHV